MTSQQILGRVRQYYEGKLAEHGATPLASTGIPASRSSCASASWYASARTTRRQASIDYGCGYGAFAAYLARERPHAAPIAASTSAATMIEAARRAAASAGRLPVRRGPRRRLRRADYTVASGIFNVKQDTGDEEWRHT